ARDARVYAGDTKDFVDWIRTTGPTSEQQVQPIVLSPSHRWSQPNSISSARSKSTMVAREPDVRGNTSGELIDFIRRGPPQQSNGDHRVPRTVAPFPSTMDSD